jgi:threonine synthase
MDISKASNFERFVFDLVGRDGAKVREFWNAVDKGGAFNIKGTAYWNELTKFGFASGKSSHQDRLKTIREVWQEYGVMIDTHTADGLKVGLEQRRPSLPLICLETALPTKFAETIREALGREPERPVALEGIEDLPQRVEVMNADVANLKSYIAARAPE